MIEARVHQQLREFLREWGESTWPHHLTMARLVARSLRVERSSLLQVGSTSAYLGHHRISYLVSLLLWPGPCVLVAPEPVQQQILMVEVPRLQEKLTCSKSIQVGDRWPDPAFRGILITTPQVWLADRLQGICQIPKHIPTLIDGVDQLEDWVQRQLAVSIHYADWIHLARAFPEQQHLVHRAHVSLTHAAFQHPPNPYQCHLLTDDDQQQLKNLGQTLVEGAGSLPVRAEACMPPQWQQFWQQFNSPNHLLWFSVNRDQGTVGLNCGPVSAADRLAEIWPWQPVVLVAATVDQEVKANTFCDRVGIQDLTCLKFAPDRHNDAIQLYLPDNLPLPNTPKFQIALQAEIRKILYSVPPNRGETVIIADDIPLKRQLAATLAGEFGSRVKVERLEMGSNGILVTGWEFWQTHQATLPAPALLIITTLPIPSLEDPLVAGRVAYYKQQRQDWFRLYLLPTALSELQRAVASVRIHQGIVALLDTRVHYRSYGRQILNALSPSACTRCLDQTWLMKDDYS